MANAVSAGGNGSLVVFNRIGDVAASLKADEVVTARVTAVREDGTATINVKGVLITARSEVPLQPGMQAVLRVASLGADVTLRFLGYRDIEAPQIEQPSIPQPDQLPDFSSNALGDIVSAQVSATLPDGGTVLQFPDGFLTVNSEVPLAKGETALFTLVPSPRQGEIDLEFAGYGPKTGTSLPLQGDMAQGLMDSHLGETVLRALAAVAAGSLTPEMKGLTKNARAELTGLIERLTALKGGMPQQIENLIRLASEAGVEPEILEKLRDLLVDMEKMNPGGLRQALEKSGVLLESRLRSLLDEGLRQKGDAASPQKNGGEPLVGDFKTRLFQLLDELQEVPSFRGQEVTAGGLMQEDVQAELTTFLARLTAQKGATPQQIEALIGLASKGGAAPELLEKLRDLQADLEKMHQEELRQALDKNGAPLENRLRSIVEGLQQKEPKGLPEGVRAELAGLIERLTAQKGVTPRQETDSPVSQRGEGRGEPLVEDFKDGQTELATLLARLTAQKEVTPQQIENLIRVAATAGAEPETLERLRDLLAAAGKSVSEEPRQAPDKDGMPLQTRLRSLFGQKAGSALPPQGRGGGQPLEDFKARLLQVQRALEEISPFRRGPAVEKALDAAQGMLREVEQYQSLSRISGSFASFLPLTWQGLAGGDAEFRRRGGDGEDAASSCRINLDLEEYGRLSVMVMFVKRGFSLYFRADEPRFRDLLSSRTTEIRGLFAKSGLFLRSVDVLDGENTIIEQLESSMEPVERAVSLTV